MSAISTIVGKLFGKTADIVDKIIPDKDLAIQLKTKLQIEATEYTHDLISEEVKSRARTLAAELAGSVIQRNWRPHLMYVIMGLLIFIIVVVPIAASFGLEIPVKDGLQAVPDQMWTLLTVGLGGYITMRSGEKIAESFSNKPK